ncbi:MAG: hypothetical protein GF331_24995, partial [Chitinivibrionales bacterium]|nr:hypothetical protein [Chitinivibrionales bacterium]
MRKRRPPARLCNSAGLFLAVMLSLCGRALCDGLPGEYLLSNRWRALYSTCSPLPNAAVLTEANYVAVRGALTRTLHEFNKLEIGITVPVGLYQSLGFTWFALGTTPYQTVQEWMAVGGEVNANDNLFMLSYAINPWRRLSVGVNVSLAHQNLFGQESRYGIGADLGLTYRLLRDPVFGEHLLGLAMA